MEPTGSYVSFRWLKQSCNSVPGREPPALAWADFPSAKLASRVTFLGIFTGALTILHPPAYGKQQINIASVMRQRSDSLQV